MTGHSSFRRHRGLHELLGALGEEAAFTLMRSLSKLIDEAAREQGGVVRGFTGDGPLV
jgi:class 3 adenylate cyclase